MELILSRNLARENVQNIRSLCILAHRPLKKHEKIFAQNNSITRFYLPVLTKAQQDEFCQYFDETWNHLCKRFNRTHPFWRNVVSSKMQEWEKSFSYLMLTLFTLKATAPTNLRLIVLCKSVQEEQVWVSWAKYNGWALDKEPVSAFNVFVNLKQGAMNILLFARLVIRGLRQKYTLPKFRLFSDNDNVSNNVLIASLFYPSSFKDNKFHDPFMGEIHKHFLDQGKRCMYVSDALSVTDASLAKKIQDCQDTIVNTPHSILSWSQLTLSFLRVLFRRYDLNNIEFMHCDFSKLIQWRAYSFENNFSMNAEIYYMAVKKVCGIHAFNQLVVIYEGNVFERACIQAFKEFSSSKVYGYSHGVVFRSNLKLRVTKEERNLRPDPDTIVCTGRHSRSMLSQLRIFEEDDLQDGCSLRFIPQCLNRELSDEKSKKVLIALDGAFATSAIMDWLIENKDLLSGYEVYFRTHPNVPIGIIEKYMLNKIPKEFIPSHGALDEDIRESSCVLYRHTSIGIQALLNGVPIIHLAIDSPLPMDPIEELHAGKRTVYDREDLQEALDLINTNKEGKVKTELDEAKDYVKGYFSSPTKQRLNQFFG